MAFIPGKKTDEFVEYKPLYERIQDWIYQLDVGVGIGPYRLGMFCLVVLMLILLYTGTQFYGLRDPEAMDAGQLARNLSRRRGYATQNIRPLEIWYLSSVGRRPINPNTNLQPELWTPPVYPLALAAVFRVFPPDFTVENAAWTVQADRVVMLTGWLFYLAGMFLMYALAREMFDHRVATMSAFMYLLCNPLLESATAGLPWGLMSVFFLAAAYAVFKAEKWQAEGRSGWWTYGALAVSAGAVALGTLTRYAFASVLVPLLIYVAVSFPQKWRAKCALCAVVFALILTPWVMRNWRASKTLFGLSRFELAEGAGEGTGRGIEAGQVQRMFGGALPRGGLRSLAKRALINGRELYEVALKDVGANYLVVFFLVGLMHRYRQEEVFRLRRFVFWSVLMAMIWMSAAGLPRGNFLTVFEPLIIVYGVAFFYVMFERLQFRTRLARTALVGAFAVFNALPFAFGLLAPARTAPYPPYRADVVTQLSKEFEPSELLCSDIPWAVAWYADRAAVWTPDDEQGFYAINDDVKVISGIYLTQQTLMAQDALQMITGYQRFWIQMFDLKTFPPKNFPLPVARAWTPDGQQVLISNRKQ
ncbi:MAG TPA: glycosyltransferase family 39 protein [Verrucomicrobiae bacterium]|nr:glycosyltransferase family 39 protein [Verrucomicrobiae bacterium]